MALIFAYFCVPDCSGRTLEEIDALFASGVSMRHFRMTKLEDLEAVTNFEAKGGKDEASVVRIEDAGS